MKILEFNKNIEKRERHHLEGRELYSLLNKSNDTILLYDLLMPVGKVEYRFRKANDNTLVAEFDKDLNMIGELNICIENIKKNKIKVLNSGIKIA